MTDKQLKQKLLAEMSRIGKEILVREIVIRVEDFEEALCQVFPEETTRLSGHTGSGRVVWKNLVDWVKARLTKQGSLYYVRVKAERYMMFLPSVGHVEGKSIVYKDSALQLARVMAEAVASARTPIARRPEGPK